MRKFSNSALLCFCYSIFVYFIFDAVERGRQRKSHRNRMKFDEMCVFHIAMISLGACMHLVWNEGKLWAPYTLRPVRRCTRMAVHVYFASLRFAVSYVWLWCIAHTHTFTLQKEGPTCEWKWIQRCAKNVHKCHKYICSMHTHTCHAPSCTHHYGNATFYLLEIICVVFFLYFNSISFARRLFGAGFGLRLYTHRYTPHNDEDALRSKSSIGRSFTLLSLAPCVRCDVAIIKFQIKPSQEKTHGAHHQCFGIIIETPSSSSSSHTQQRDYGRWFVS